MKHALKKFLHWLKGAFTKNIGMKIGALVFAFLLWSFVLAEQDPIRTKEFQDIPVTFVGADTLRQKDLAVTRPLSDLADSVTITVETNADRMFLLTEGMLSAEIDLSSISDAGTKTLPITPKSTMSGLAMTVSPADVVIEVDAIETKTVPVEVELVGTRKNWLFYGEPVLSDDTIEITGAQSNVDQVARAVCRVDIENLEASSKETRPVTLLDENGEEIPSNWFSSVPSVIVEIPIYPKKTVPVDTANIMENVTGVAPGFEVTAVTTDPAGVEVAGLLDNIDLLTSIRVEPVELENAQADQNVTAKVVVPDGVYNVSPSEVQVHLTISPEQAERVYAAVDIGVKNLGEGLVANLQPSAVDVEVRGDKTALDNLSARQIVPFVDLQDLPVGIHTVEIKFENEPDLGVASITPSSRTVKVTISADES